ncbi:uncharacterized protein LOC123293326 isoform X2 [Chrysoperla carnea]|nr:uncharacterized protein LOC123293326 isoform X2 [Chrysoperla carnea]XP_044730040.1 uncharacterized protein LOC123293326 isoform X2 [Chrysoperla carnea]XP_044730041.1 uncharacterized protein LOC123293326 isoform X2 [Chrysoperla carnea]
MKRNHAGQYTYSQQNKSYANNNKSYGSNQNLYSSGGGGGNNSSTNSYQTNKLNTPPPILPNTYSVPPPPITDPTRLYYSHNSPNRNTYTNIPSAEPPGTPPSIHNIRNGIVPVTHHHTNYYVPLSPYHPPRIQWAQSISPMPGGIDTSTPPPRRWPPPSPLVMGANVYVPRPSPPIRKKQRKKTIAQNVPSREIKIEDAEAALKCEMEHTYTTKQLMIRFPDPPIDRDTVLKFNPNIKKVHFQQPSTPRYCFIQLDEDADTEKVIQELREVKFGLGNLRVELKHDATRRAKAEDIDPYVLFVGNISQHTPAETIKTLFHPGRVDIGPSQKIKNSRYALVKFNTAQEAIEVFKKTQGIMVGDHSLNVRFRRLNGSVGFPGDKVIVKKAAITPANAEEENNKNEETSKASTSKSSNQNLSKDDNQKTDGENNHNNDLPPVKKEEEYFYYEHPEPADEMDIKLKNEYFNEQNEYYMEHPEYEYDYDYFYESGFADNQDVQSSSSSTTYTSTMTPNENDHLDANEFAAQLKSQLQQNESSSTSRNNGQPWSVGRKNDLGPTVKQIHLPPPPKTAPPEIPPPPPGPPPGPPPAPPNRYDIPSNLDEIRVKSELENDGYENRCDHDDDDENDETRQFLSELQKLSENISNDRSSSSTSRPNEAEHVPKSECDTQDHNKKNTDLFVRIPRDKIKINSLASINNRQDDKNSSSDFLSFSNNR